MHFYAINLITAGWTQLDKRLIEALTAWSPKIIIYRSHAVIDILDTILKGRSLKHFSRLDMILLVPP